MLELARTTDLFRGLADGELQQALDRANAVRRQYRKGETVMHAGFPADRILVVAEGMLHVYEHSKYAHPVLVREIGPGEVLGLWILHVPSVACWPGTVVAARPSTIISLDMARARALLEAADPRTVRIAVNASKILSRELFSTWRKLLVMDAHTIEERIRIYLSELDIEGGRTGTVAVPFDRERMAEYFGVTRPAISRALGRMRDRGLLSWRKNVFRLSAGFHRTGAL